MPLLAEVTGDFHYPVSSDNELAQRYFDQGFQLMYGFAKMEAVRSFHASWQQDPDCAICYWGEAWAWGSYLNGAMTTAEAPRALAAARNALEKINNASPKEADMIQAIQVRYVEDYEPETRRVQDELYRDAAELAAKQRRKDTHRKIFIDSGFLKNPDYTYLQELHRIAGRT